MKNRENINTARLLLRPFALSDAAEVQRLAGDRAIADTTLTVPHPYLDGLAEQWIATHAPKFEAGELVNFAIVERQRNQLVGAIGLTLEKAFDCAELGYWVGRPHWGLGYCTEAAAAVVRLGFTRFELNRIHARYLQRNPASGRVMHKIGMVQEGVAREHTKKWGRYENVVMCAILRKEWVAERGDFFEFETGR